MELAFYNAVLTGMSCDGKKFTYVNQLTSSEADASKREEWFTCACCPPNMLRILGYLGGYVWTYSANDVEQAALINVHLFMSATLKFAKDGDEVILEQKTGWPWKGDIELSLKSASKKIAINLRILGWASDWTVSHEHSSL